MSYPVVQQIKGNFYLYEATAVWDPTKKRSKQTRVYIGKCDEYGNLLKARHQRPSSANKMYGSSYLMKELMTQIGIDEKLEAAFDKKTANSLIALSIMRVIRPGSVRRICDRIDETHLPEMLSLNDSTKDNFIKLLSKIGNDRLCRNIFCSSLVDGTDAIIFDMTSFRPAIHPDDLETEFSSVLPRTDLGLVYSSTTDSMMYYRVIAENDIPSLNRLAEELAELGVEDLEYVIGRGFYSEPNMSELLEKNVSFTVALPFNHKIAKVLMSESVRPLADPTNAHMFGNNLYRVYETTSSIAGRDMRTIVYMDEDKHTAELKILYTKLGAFEERMKRTGWYPEILDDLLKGADKDLLRMYDISESGDGMVSAIRKRNSITATENKFGKLILLSTTDRSWTELLKMHQKMNDMETQLSTLRKDLEEDDPFSKEELKGIIFVEFLSFILRAELTKRIEKAEMNISIKDLIESLNKLRMNFTGKEWKLSEMTEKERTIFQKLDVIPPDHGTAENEEEQ